LGLEIQQRLAYSGIQTKPAPVSDGEEGPVQPIPVGKGDKEILSQNGKPIRMQGFANGRKQYDLNAQRLVISQGERSAAGEKIGGVLLGKDGVATLRFTADQAIMDQLTKNLDVQGRVRVQSLDPKNPVLFETQGVHWQAAEEKLQCNTPVQVTQPGVVLRANKMTADVRLKKLSLAGGIYLEADANKVKKNLELLQGLAKKGGQ
ncbi:MAG TPA: LPS export ABC transporter periplasmic protein LptC, partial [Armatimonadota bacterium]|nr:LPS export ABC transporter periplasmic protein LptC [Armatimonadota bacterium]